MRKLGNMYIARKVDSALLEWANGENRKPLLVRGARQTGKTSSVRNLARNFDSFIELNFEEDQRLCAIFEESLDVHRICSQIEAVAGKRIVPGKTLLFLDEIQACPRAISALRYFYEKIPELHVIATGSLLEFAFEEIPDFGVGRIRNLFAYPMSFSEFLSATGDDLVLAHALEASFENPIPAILHERLLGRLKEYLVVGGMPAAVRVFAETKSFLAAQREQDDILVALKSDFGKYRKRVPPERVRNTLSAIVRQTGEKFTYTDSLLGLSWRQSRECTDLLEMAKLAVRVSASHANGLPLGGDLDAKSNKFLFLDIGLYLRESGLDVSEWMLDAPGKFVNRGKLAEMLVGLELLKSGSPFVENRLYYWHREAKSSNAEVDYVAQIGKSIVPIEVKSGSKGAMKSMRIMMEEKGLPLGIRTSEENLGVIGNVRIVPLYMIGEIAKLLSGEMRGIENAAIPE